MTGVDGYKSGKGEHDENFPVASHLIARRHRGPILAFYRFARAADDAADHPTLDPDAKFALLAALEETLLGKSDRAADALPLRALLKERGLSPEHALDLLTAFRQDVTKSRYATWEELTDYCRYSAMPVGRFVLDVHGESRSTWGASDALCTALQIINHLQDCGKDYRSIGRIYVPQDALKRNNVADEAFAREKSSPELLACLHDTARRTAVLLPKASLLPKSVSDLRLVAETSVIVSLAGKLIARLETRDPLAGGVHLAKSHAALIGARAAAIALARRVGGKRNMHQAVGGDVQ